MTCEIINTFIGISAITTIFFISWMQIKYPNAPFLSQAYYKLKNVYMYMFIFILIGAPIISVSGFDLWFTLAAVSLMLVATFPNYKKLWVNIPHSLFAFTAGACGFIGFYQHTKFWQPIIPYVLISIWLYFRTKNPIKWIEILTFVMIEVFIIMVFYCKEIINP